MLVTPTPDTDTVAYLLSAAAVRERAHQVLDLMQQYRVSDWRLDLSRMEVAADLTAETVRQNYPDLNVPFHARWRHFMVGGRDLWAERDKPTDRLERGRAAFDLVIPSVLLDAGAGPGWQYVDETTGATLSRSEGLGVASLRLFEAGMLSSDPGDPLRADALGKVDAALIERAFQVTDANPLVGVEGRATLLRRLGEVVGRPADIFDTLVARATDGELPAPVILEVLLDVLGPIWPSRLSLDGRPLGDCWRLHVRRSDPDGPVPMLVPLHKLSQWMSYSLIEPLQDAGIEVIDIDGLTGLAEYRNGGLFVDTGVLTFFDPGDDDYSHALGSDLVISWRAMTVALLDRLAPMVRERLGVTAEAFPLARMLEGGSWAAGRRIAREKRADGGPPVKLLSDGDAGMTF
jgi:hypothetical protein